SADSRAQREIAETVQRRWRAAARLDRLDSAQQTASDLGQYDDTVDPISAAIEHLVHRLASALSLPSIQVHADSLGQARTASIGARGLAEDGHIYLDTARVAPESAEGRRVIAHEVAHVAQEQLTPTQGPMAAALAEGEAWSFANTYVSSGDVTPLRFGLPSGHVAADNAGGLAPVVLDMEAVVMDYTANVDTNLAALLADPSFQELVAAHEEPETSEEESSTSESSMEGESDTDVCDDTEASSTSGEDEPAGESVDPVAVLETLKASPSYALLTEDYARTLTVTSHGVITELQIGFDSSVEALALEEAAQQALTMVMDAIMVEAEELAVCEDVPGIEEAVGTWPADPLAMYPELGELMECPIEEVESLEESEVEESPEEPPVCEVEETPVEEPEPIVSSIGDELDAVGSAGSLGAAEDEASAIDVDLDFCATFSVEAGQDGAGLHLDRLGTIAATMGASAVGPFLENAIYQLGDTFIMDSLGTLLDAKIADKLSGWTKFPGDSSIPIVGPLLSIGSRVVPAIWAGDWRVAFQAETEGWAELQENFGQSVAAFNKALAAETWEDRVYHGTDAVGEAFQTLASAAGLVAGISGLLSALLFVGAFALGFFSGGTAAAVSAAMIPVAKVLGEVATVSGIFALWAKGVSMVLSAAAAAMAPVDEWGDALVEVEEQSANFGEDAG
ncbi:MAG: DUF4157 domain-containing protein, partial [Myxococcota bacterium]|nr:DUF4157 domain-containing protein [Myxococcota bacterium]